MKLTIEIELSDKEARQLQDNSIERVHQTAANTLRAAERRYRGNEAYEEDRYTAYHDLRYFGPLANKLWNAARNAVYIHKTDKEEHHDSGSGEKTKDH